MAELPIPGLEKIEHLVILMMENRSFDHYLGALSLPPENRKDIDGYKAGDLPSNPDLAGNPIPAWDMKTDFFGYGDPPHGREAQESNYNKGQLDGFVKNYEASVKADQEKVTDGSDPSPSKIPMGYYTRETLPVLYALADQFTVCDRWFSSMLSSTWPNRKYLHSGRRDDDDDTQTLPPFPGFKTTPIYEAIEDTRDPDTGNKHTWKCYFSDLPFLAFWYKFAAFHALSNFTSIDNFVHDCRENQLPTVTVIDPAFSIADDHPTHDVQLGQKFIGLVVDALTHSESWQNTALVLLYDENGAFFDHVRPPKPFEEQAGETPLDTPLGFRVPAVVISPYAKSGQACHTVFDHTSIMKSIHMRWGVDFPEETYGSRWEHASDIWSSCFDFDQEPLPMGTYTQPKKDVENDVPSPMRDVSWESGIHDLVINRTGGLESMLERIFILPVLKTLDKRVTVFDSLAAMEQNVVRLKRVVQDSNK